MNFGSYCHKDGKNLGFEKLAGNGFSQRGMFDEVAVILLTPV